jgi:hypothetical protein
LIVTNATPAAQIVGGRHIGIDALPNAFYAGAS